MHIFTLKVGKPRKNIPYTLKASDLDGNKVVVAVILVRCDIADHTSSTSDVQRATCAKNSPLVASLLLAYLLLDMLSLAN